MPAKDRYHDAVRRALIKDGWTIESEQTIIPIEERSLYIDIEAIKSLDERTIFVEVKELKEVLSPVEALANAFGKYRLYRLALAEIENAAILYLAVTEASYYEGILSERLGKLMINDSSPALLIFDPEREEIVQWIP